jgi:hypothetical protein
VSFVKRNLGLLTLSASVLLVNETNPPDATHAQVPDHGSAMDAVETTRAKIARALSACPPEVARSARAPEVEWIADRVRISL